MAKHEWEPILMSAVGFGNTMTAVHGVLGVGLLCIALLFKCLVLLNLILGLLHICLAIYAWRHVRNLRAMSDRLHPHTEHPE